MYCVKCGRKAREGEKHCSKCGMRLVSPAKLKRLLEESNERARRAKRIASFKSWTSKALNRASVFLAFVWTRLKALFAQLLAWLQVKLPLLWQSIKHFSAKAAAVAKVWFKRIKKRARILKRGIERKLSGSKREKAAASNRSGQAKSQRTPRTSRESGRQSAQGKTRYAAERNAYGQNKRPQRSADRSASDHHRSAAGSQADRAAKTARHAPVRKKPRTFKQKLRRFWSIATSEKHLRSTVAMGLLLIALIVFVGWSTLSNPGKRTYARLGMGSAQGYILLGDEYMSTGNYGRAVESYYASITRKASYAAAFKLAVAYSYTNDITREVSALLYCAEKYPENKAPFVQLNRLYPDESSRPERVQNAIQQGTARYGSLN